MFYKYEFTSKGLIDKAQNIFCYYLQVGVLDLERWIHKFCCMSSLKPSERAVFQVLPDT